MKKFSIIFIATLFAIAAEAQIMNVWSGNKVIFGQSVSSIDSITFSIGDEPGQGETMSQDMRYITGGVWGVYNASNRGATYYIFAKNGHARVYFINRNGYKNSDETGDWIYNEQNKKLITTIAGYSWDMNIISETSMQGDLSGGGSSGFALKTYHSFVDTTQFDGTYEHVSKDAKIVVKGNRIQYYEKNVLKVDTTYQMRTKVAENTNEYQCGLYYDEFLELYGYWEAGGTLVIVYTDSEDQLAFCFTDLTNRMMNIQYYDQNNKEVNSYHAISGEYRRVYE